MLVVGLFLFAAMVASAVVLIVSNRGVVVSVQVLGHSWTGHLYWLLLVGLVVALVGVLGLAMMRASAVRPGRLRRQRAALATARGLASERVRDPATSPFFADAGRIGAVPPVGRRRTGRRSASGRGHHAL